MNKLVKIYRNDDGVLIDKPVWHLVDPENITGEATFCGSEFFGLGESAVDFQVKEVESGGIECPECMKKLLAYKRIKL